MTSTTATITTECPECGGIITVITDGTRAYALTESPLISSQVWDRIEQDGIVAENPDTDGLLVTCQSRSLTDEEPCDADVALDIRAAVISRAVVVPFMTEIVR